MLTLLTICIFALSFMVVHIGLTIFLRDKLMVSMRLQQIKGKNKEKSIDELSIPFYHRVMKPIIEKIFGGISKRTSGSMKKRMDDKLTMAGHPYNLSADKWFMIRIVLGLVIPVSGLIIFIMTGNINSKNLLAIVGVTAILNLLPVILLQQKTRERQKSITNALPDVLDLLSVSVEAGLSFDGALAHLVEKMPGVLTSEFNKALQEMRVGKSKKDALRAMGNRCDVMDLTTLIGSLVQADELGVSISNVLRIQSVQIRQKRRQRAQEKAMKAPVKMLFPLVMFIFPTLFAVLLGPAVIMIAKAFTE